MRAQAQRLNPSEIRVVSEFVTGKTLAIEVVESINRTLHCPDAPCRIMEKTPHWNGWGGNMLEYEIPDCGTGRAVGGRHSAAEAEVGVRPPRGDPCVVAAVRRRRPRLRGRPKACGCTRSTRRQVAPTGRSLAPGRCEQHRRNRSRAGPPRIRMSRISAPIPGWVYALDANTGQEALENTVAEDHRFYADDRVARFARRHSVCAGRLIRRRDGQRKRKL